MMKELRWKVNCINGSTRQSECAMCLILYGVCCRHLYMKILHGCCQPSPSLVSSNCKGKLDIIFFADCYGLDIVYGVWF
jgi:hypothetical protein